MGNSIYDEAIDAGFDTDTATNIQELNTYLEDYYDDALEIRIDEDNKVVLVYDVIHENQFPIHPNTSIDNLMYLIRYVRFMYETAFKAGAEETRTQVRNVIGLY